MPDEPTLRLLADRTDSTGNHALGTPLLSGRGLAEVIVFAATNSSKVLTGQTLHARPADGVTLYEQSGRKPDSSAEANPIRVH